MNYDAAFKLVVSKYGYEVIGNNPLLRSLLSDLVKDSIVDKQLIAAFAILNADNMFFMTIRYLSLLEAKEYIKKKIVASNKSYSVEQYIRSTEPLLTLLYPNEYVPYKGNSKVVVNNVVRNKKSISKPLIQPKVNKAPKQVVNVAKKAKAVHQSNGFSKIVVNARCSQLLVNNSSGNQLCILDTKNNNVTSSVNQYIKNKTLYVSLSNSRQTYTISVPKKEYDSLEISFSGNILRVERALYENFLVKKLKINANCSSISVTAKSQDFSCNINSGMFHAFGEYSNVSVYSNSADCYLGLSNANARKLNVVTNSGKIEVEFYGYSVRPKINHILKKIKTAQGIYYVNGKPVSFNLFTNSGSIKVR